MAEKLGFEVVGGMCRIEFRPGSSCGPDEDCNPGIGFDLISDVPAHAFGDGKYRAGIGVFSRADATRLRDALDAFLEEHPSCAPQQESA